VQYALRANTPVARSLLEAVPGFCLSCSLRLVASRLLSFAVGQSHAMTTTVQFDDTRIELSRPLADRPDVIVVMTDDGRRAILGDGRDFVIAGHFEALCEAMCTSNARR